MKDNSLWTFVQDIVAITIVLAKKDLFSKYSNTQRELKTIKPKFQLEFHWLKKSSEDVEINRKKALKLYEDFFKELSRGRGKAASNSRKTLHQTFQLHRN